MTNEEKDDMGGADAVLAVLAEDAALVAPVERNGVVRRDDYVVYAEAQRLLEAVRERAGQIQQQAESDAKRDRERGYQEGLAEGRAEMFALISRYQASIRDAVDTQVEDLMDLVASCAEQAIGKVLPKEFIAELVGQALHRFAESRRVDVYARSKSISDLESALEAEGVRGAAQNVRFVGDNDLAEDEFRLVTSEFSVSYSRAQLLTVIRETLTGGTYAQSLENTPGVNDG